MIRKAVIWIAWATAVSPLSATVLVHTFEIETPAGTDFHHVIDVPQWYNQVIPDALTNVTFKLTATLTGELDAENLNNNYANNVTMALAAGMSLLRDDNSNILDLALNDDSINRTLMPYDGVFDYGGTSGLTIADLSAGGYTLAGMGAGDIERFTGQGSVVLYLNATNNSSLFASKGNVDFDSTANIIYTLDVTYYDFIPEPSSMTLFVTAVSGLLGYRRTKRKWREKAHAVDGAAFDLAETFDMGSSSTLHMDSLDCGVFKPPTNFHTSGLGVAIKKLEEQRARAMEWQPEVEPEPEPEPVSEIALHGCGCTGMIVAPVAVSQYVFSVESIRIGPQRRLDIPSDEERGLYTDFPAPRVGKNRRKLYAFCFGIMYRKSLFFHSR